MPLAFIIASLLSQLPEKKRQVLSFILTSHLRKKFLFVNHRKEEYENSIDEEGQLFWFRH